MSMEIKLNADELAVIREADGLKTGFNAGVEMMKQVFLQRVMRERSATAKAQEPPPAEATPEQPKE